MLRKTRIAGLLFTIGLTAACGNPIQDFRELQEERPNGVQAIRSYAPEINTEVSIGETARTGSLAMSVTSARATDGRDSNLRVPAPPRGYVYLLVNVTLDNLGDEAEHMSSRMRISLLDSESRTQEWALFPAAAGSIDGRIGPGQQRVGELTWRVPENAEGLKMVFGDAAFSIGNASGYWPEPPSNRLSISKQDSTGGG